MIYFQSLTLDDLTELLKPLGKKGEAKALTQALYRAKQIYHWVYQKHVLEWDQMTDLSKDLRVWLNAHVTIFRLKPQTSQQALDGTHKFLWELPDHKTIESVIIPAALQEKQSVPHEESEVFCGTCCFRRKSRI